MLQRMKYLTLGLILAMLALGMTGTFTAQASPGMSFTNLLNIVKPAVVFIVEQTPERTQLLSVS